MAVSVITVLLADDHVIVREGVRFLINSNKDLRVIGEVGTGAQAVVAAKSLRPDVIVMDIAMPVLGGLDATRQILATTPAAKILLLSAYLDDEYIHRAMTIGAMGYLVKQTSSLLLADAIRTIYGGRKIFSPVVESRLQPSQENLPGRIGKAAKRIAELTSREVQVLRLIAGGQDQSRGRPVLGHQHENGGEAPAKRDEQAEHSRCRRTDTLCDCGGPAGKPCSNE